MIGFKTTLLKFDQQGEKTGWTYILIPANIAEKIKAGNKKSFRVKGRVDDHCINAVALMPMGGGDFIMAVNSEMRKVIRKNKGATVIVELEEDTTVMKLSAALLSCLDDDPESKAYFNKLAPSHRQYYSKWIESAKTESTKIRRIAMAIDAFSKKLSYGQMLRLNKNKE